jgi:hypothetical protein
MVRAFKQKTEDKYDKETLRTAISEYREKKASLNSAAKKVWGAQNNITITITITTIPNVTKIVTATLELL